MRIVGVIDLLHGRAVHAQGGCRQAYRPVDRVDSTIIAGDPVMLARAYIDLGIDALYVADLDAIAGAAEPDDAVRGVAAAGIPLWLDAGVATVAQARRAAACGAARVVVGLETMATFSTVTDIANAIGADRTSFSLDLRDGQPVTGVGEVRGLAPEVIARRAVDAGATSVVVLDLARIGSGRGVDVGLLQGVRGAVPDVPLLAGGGVRGPEDLLRLAELGCDGVLMATALHGPRGRELVRAGAAAGHGKVTR